MSWAELRGLPRTHISLGAHTVSHPNLSELGEEQRAHELRDCRREIEERIGRVVETLAYPYGASSRAVRALAKREFQLAFGTSLRFVGENSDTMDLPRIDTYYLRAGFQLENLMTPYGRVYLGLRRFLREVRACLSR